MKSKALIIIIFLLFIIDTGCSKPDIKIGFAAGLTGRYSELGKSGMYGAMLAVDEINENGGINGRKLDLVIKDDKSDPKTSLDVDIELKESGCVAIVGHYISSVSSLTVPYVNNNDLLMISPTITTTNLSGRNDNFLRVAPDVSRQADGLYELINSDRKINVGIFYSDENIAYSGDLKNVLVKKFNENGMIKYYEIPFSKEKPLITKNTIDMINMNSFDSIVIIASADDTAILCQYLYQNKLIIDKYCSTWALTGDLISHGGKSVEGMKGVNFVDYSSTNIDYINFKNAYMKKYSIEPDFSSIYSYETIKILEKALMKSKAHSASEIKKTILAEGVFTGLQSEFSLDSFGDCERNLFVSKIVNSRLVAINE